MNQCTLLFKSLGLVRLILQLTRTHSLDKKATVKTLIISENKQYNKVRYFLFIIESSKIASVSTEILSSYKRLLLQINAFLLFKNPDKNISRFSRKYEAAQLYSTLIIIINFS